MNNYEICEGMARVYGTSDEAQAMDVKQCREENHVHPFLYSRKASPISIGGPAPTLFRASGEFVGHLINEIKVMVPVQEVIESEKIISELEPE